LLTLGIVSGSVWANEAWGSFWNWDIKETWSLITWLLYAFYIHSRLQLQWQGKPSALVASIGLFVVLICYLGVNLMATGMHSYGWLTL
jgi:cytochrome c-type biogenesis protein CcsB